MRVRYRLICCIEEGNVKIFLEWITGLHSENVTLGGLLKKREPKTFGRKPPKSSCTTDLCLQTTSQQSELKQ